jgi:DNA repair ATPase RecN
MRLVLPGPSGLLRLASRVLETAGDLLELAPRLLALLSQVEEIVRILRTIDDVELRIADAVEKGLSIVDRVEPLVAEFEPTLRVLHPVVRRLAETTDPDEVEAIVRLINDLPELVAKIHVDVLPVLSTLGTVPDDLRELIVTSKELNEIIASVPGMSRMRQRAMRELAEQNRAIRQRERDAQRSPAD